MNSIIPTYIFFPRFCARGRWRRHPSSNCRRPLDFLGARSRMFQHIVSTKDRIPPERTHTPLGWRSWKSLARWIVLLSDKSYANLSGNWLVIWGVGFRLNNGMLGWGQVLSLFGEAVEKGWWTRCSWDGYHFQRTLYKVSGEKAKLVRKVRAQCAWCSMRIPLGFI